MAFGSMNEGKDTPMADINVTPLVDVMLVLLIVFMITMPVMTHSIPMQLPIASEKQTNQPEPKDPLRLSIAPDGSYHLGSGAALSAQALQAELTKAVADNPDTILAIAADKSVPYEKVADALGAARDAGLSKVGFVTEEKN